MLKYIKHCWKGEEKLWEVFWIWNILVGGLLSFITLVTLMVTVLPVAMMVSFNESFEGVTFPKLLLCLPGIFLFLLSIVYDVWALVSLWRSAFNCSKKIFGYLARLWIVVVIYFGIIAPILGIIFPGSIFDDSDDVQVYIEEGPIQVGPERLPTEEEWNQIKKGMTTEQVQKVIGKHGSIQTNEDGSEVWTIYKTEAESLGEALFYDMYPTGKVFYIYFDSSKRVEHKEIKFIPKEKVEKLWKKMKEEMDKKKEMEQRS